LPHAVAQYQLAVALQFLAQCSVAKQIHHHRLARRAQLRDLVAQRGIIEMRRENHELAPAEAEDAEEGKGA